MKKTDGIKIFIGIGSLFIFSFVTTKFISLPLVVINIIALYVFVGVVPICRKHENVWLFLLTFFQSMPINIKLTGIAMSSVFQKTMGFQKIIMAIEVYMALLALEEIVIGVAGRLLWRRQCCIEVGGVEQEPISIQSSKSA